MEDDHVDRPGVDAQQCVKLTGTNRSTGLIPDHPPQPKISYPGKIYRPSGYLRFYLSGIMKAQRTHSDRNTLRTTEYVRKRGALSSRPKAGRGLPENKTLPGIDGLVAIARAEPPDPIPNSAVKSLRAHGTAS